MPVTYTNRKGKTFYLHQGVTKTGKPRLYLSPKSEGTLAEAIPDGFEIYENPNAQVFLRKILPRLITDWEIQVVQHEMRRFPHLKYWRVDIKGDTITLFTPNQDVAGTEELFLRYRPDGINAFEEWANESLSYSPMLRFVLQDEDKRIFVTRRYCFRSSVDDWIQIGLRGPLADLARQFVQHLGQESFYELIG
jgi:hypothetical protein